MDTCACPGGIDLDEMPRSINPKCQIHNRFLVKTINQFVCDGSCAGNELGDCNHGKSNDGRVIPTEHPECCGGGSFYGHKSFCDVGHVRAGLHTKKRLEALEMIASCARDVVDFWPSMSFKTIRIMIPKMQTLKEALEMLK